MEEHYLLSLFVFIIFGVIFSKKENNTANYTSDNPHLSASSSSELSGVAKYLESKNEAAPSGVAKYLENKQSLEDSQKPEHKVSGVAKYLASKNEVPVSSVSKYMARKASNSK